MASDCRGLGGGKGRRQVAKRWARGSTVWKEEGQGGGKDSPQVDTIAKSHQVQVSRCFYAPMREREGRREGRERARRTSMREREGEGRWARRKRKVKIVKGRRMGIEGFPVIIQQGGPAGQVGLS